MPPRLVTTLLLAGFVSASATASGDERDGVFSIIGLPDTQNYSESYPEIYAGQTNWVVERIRALDIRFVTHFGDIVQHADLEEEWLDADEAMLVLDAAGVPQGVTSGNHDITANGLSGEPYIPENYLFYFGPDRYVGRSFFQGASATVPGAAGFATVPGAAGVAASGDA